MNVLLTMLQVFLAAHTAIGAIWKWSNSERTMPSLAAVPHAVWVSLSVPELLCVVALVVPLFAKRATVLAAIGAGFVILEMLYFCAVSLTSGSGNVGSVIYWLIVAAVAAFVAYGRLAPAPIRYRERV